MPQPALLLDRLWVLTLVATLLSVDIPRAAQPASGCATTVRKVDALVVRDTLRREKVRRGESSARDAFLAAMAGGCLSRFDFVCDYTVGWQQVNVKQVP